MQEGLSEASVLLRKIQSFTDPRLYALSVVAQNLASSSQPLVPERVFMAPGSGGAADGGSAAGTGLMGMLMSLLVAEKSGFDLAAGPSNGSGLQDFTDAIAKQAMENIQAAMASNAAEAAPAPLAADPVPPNGLVVGTT